MEFLETENNCSYWAKERKLRYGWVPALWKLHTSVNGITSHGSQKAYTKKYIDPYFCAYLRASESHAQDVYLVAHFSNKKLYVALTFPATIIQVGIFI